MAMTKEERQEYTRNYYAKNAEKIKAASTKYNKENRGLINIRKAKYRAENLEKAKVYQATYRAKNREGLRERGSKYRLENEAVCKSSKYKWRIKNSEKVKAYDAKRVVNTTDSYVRGKLVSQGFPKESITNELIEVKRLIIKTKRL